jgi:hypothetical protein
MDIVSVIIGALPGAVLSGITYLTTASRTRTNERFKFIEDSLAEVKESVRVGDEAEERRRTEALRDLDARTSRAIDSLRDEIARRFEDLKSLLVTR